MPRRDFYLIRRVADGKIRTVVAFSPRGAMERFTVEYRPPAGEVFEVKPRGRGDWEAYKVIR